MRPERRLPALVLLQLALRGAEPGVRVEEVAGQLRVERRVGRRDLEVAQLDLRLRPRQVERALRAVGILVAVGELLGARAIGGHERREGDARALAGRHPDARPQREHGIEDRAHRPREGAVAVEGQRVADAFSTGGNPTPQQMMEARDLLRHAADEIDAMLASVGFAQKPPLPNNELAEIRREIAGLREEVAALRRPEARPTMATTATVSRYVEAPPDLMPYAPPGEAPTPLT